MLQNLSFAQISTEQQIKSAIPSNARYEIVQSSLMRKATFKLDKYKGFVYQMVSTKSGGITWEMMVRLDHPSDTILDGKTVNYQLFLSGMVMKDTFLINIRTGATWIILEDSESGVLFWSPVE